jgi:hypothetical protein
MKYPLNDILAAVCVGVIFYICYMLIAVLG